MATNQPARGSADESVSEFVQRRNREQAARGQARAAGHQAYGEAIRAKLDLDFPTPGDVEAYGGQAGTRTASPGHETLRHNFVETPAAQIGHPGIAESLVPIWGPGREALADLADGKPLSAGFDAGLTALDLLGAGMAGKLASKSGAYALRGPLFRPAKEAQWPYVRDQMRKFGLIKEAGVTKKGNVAYEQGRHWLLPQRWTWAPKPILNHPFNIHSMERAAHARLRHSFQGLPRFGLPEQYWRGTPHWSKVVTGEAAGHVASAAEAKADTK